MHSRNIEQWADTQAAALRAQVDSAHRDLAVLLAQLGQEHLAAGHPFDYATRSALSLDLANLSACGPAQEALKAAVDAWAAAVRSALQSVAQP